VCLPLLEYLQVASTQPSAGNPRPPTLHNRLGRADYPIRPAVLSQRRASILYRQLPALRPSDTGRIPDSFAEGLSEGITNISSKMHADRRSRETRVSEASWCKTFREKYGDRIADEILLFTSAVVDDFLPAFYQDLGGKAKGESERVLLQREVDQCAEVFDVLPFKISPSQVISLKTFDFAGLSMAEVGTGPPPSASYLPRPPPTLPHAPYPSTIHRRKPTT
jgi:hypothetical protein